MSGEEDSGRGEWGGRLDSRKGNQTRLSPFPSLQSPSVHSPSPVARPGHCPPQEPVALPQTLTASLTTLLPSLPAPSLPHFLGPGHFFDSLRKWKHSAENTFPSSVSPPCPPQSGPCTMDALPKGTDPFPPLEPPHPLPPLLLLQNSSRLHHLLQGLWSPHLVLMPSWSLSSGDRELLVGSPSPLGAVGVAENGLQPGRTLGGGQ